MVRIDVRINGQRTSWLARNLGLEEASLLLDVLKSLRVREGPAGALWRLAERGPDDGKRINGEHSAQVLRELGGGK